MIFADEIAADQESLGQAFRPGLSSVTDANADLAPVLEQPFIKREVRGSGDEQNIANARDHERGQGIINHWLVVHGQELLANHTGDGREPRA